MPMLRFQFDFLYKLARALFIAAGTPIHIAESVARIIVKSNLTGHDSHGVLRIPRYLEQIDSGTLNPIAEPTIIKDKPNMMIIDGHHGFGHYTAQQGMHWAIKKAKKSAICAVSFQRTGHMGRMGEYVEMAAKAGFISLIISGHAGEPDCRVVPYGGICGALGTNPMAVGVPTGDVYPFVLDLATSTSAEGNLQVARSNDQTLPKGTIINKDGEPSVDVADFYDGGFLLPFGGPKGYGIAIWITLMCGLSGQFSVDEGIMTGKYLQVINVESFLPLSVYEAGVRACLDKIRATPHATDSEEVLIPGDRTYRNYANHMNNGIELPDSIWRQIQSWADYLSIDMASLT